MGLGTRAAERVFDQTSPTSAAYRGEGLGGHAPPPSYGVLREGAKGEGGVTPLPLPPMKRATGMRFAAMRLLTSPSRMIE
jgi:hypothetical protein